MTKTKGCPVTRVVDLFAGPGGWDVAARDLGLDVLGIEFDSATCRTRRAAGLPTVEGDVREHHSLITDSEPYVGLIASPPCQTFSAAGNGAGRRAMDDVLHGINLITLGLPVPAFDDERTGLVLEPLVWALDAIDQGRPFEWLAFEQVPSVLPVWEAIAVTLRLGGYSVATGCLNAEQYGVPQTRRRAVLVARLNGEACLPAPTHSRYHSRSPERLDEGVLPWVSMAEALDWGMTARPYPTVACSRNSGGPDKEKVGGSAARAVIYREQAEGRWALRSSAQSKATVRDADTPAPTITAGHDSGERQWVQRSNYSAGTSNGQTAAERGRTTRKLTEPGTTVSSKGFQWQPIYVNGTGKNAARRPADTPAPTVHFGARLNTVSWAEDRPSTTVNGDPRIGPPGHKCMTDDCHPGRGTDPQFGPGTVRVSIEEAAVLQSFPADYPWQGNKSERFRQVGNAIPPQLAYSILKEVVQ